MGKELLKDYLKFELASLDLELVTKSDGREGVDFLIGNHGIYLQPFDLDTVKQSIKIPKQDLGELNDDLFIALVLIIEQQPRVVYLIPSTQLEDSNDNFFVNNEVSSMPSLSNWEIKISSKSIVELEKYALNNMITKLEP